MTKAKPWTPDSIPEGGLLSWLSLDENGELVEMCENATCSWRIARREPDGTEVMVEIRKASEVRDTSGNERHAVQSDPTRRPTVAIYGVPGFTSHSLLTHPESPERGPPRS